MTPARVPDALLTADPRAEFPAPSGECRPVVTYWRDGLWSATCSAHPRFTAVASSVGEASALANTHARVNGRRPVTVSVSPVWGSFWRCSVCSADGAGFALPSEAVLAGLQHWGMKHGQGLVSCQVVRPHLNLEGVKQGLELLGVTIDEAEFEGPTWLL